MIKKLKIKFVAITLSLVFLVLIGVFSVLLISTASMAKNESVAAMQRMASRDVDTSPPKLDFDKKGKPDRPFLIYPIFCITVDKEWNVLSITSENSTISQEAAINAMDKMQVTQKESGVLHSLDLRFIRIETAEGYKLVFADRSNEHNAINSLLLNSVFVGFGSLIAFFFISLFLANRAIKPISLAWEQQRQFVADASHELKTPLTVILANTSILMSHKADTVENQMKWIEHTETEAELMKKMVDSLLFLARSDSVSTPTLHSSFCMTDEAFSCLLPFEPVAYENGIKLELDIAPSLNMTGDQTQIKQLMAILTDNACKYSKKGSTVFVRLSSYKADKLLFKISNSGNDIPQEDLPHIFERFYRSDKSRSRDGGFGLGLSIAKTIVDNHKGKISAVSENGITTFTVTLPQRGNYKKAVTRKETKK